MIQGLYNAASGMIALEAQHTILANNIANVSTPGFKSYEPVQLGFYTTFSDKLHRSSFFDAQSAPAGGVKTVENYPDLAVGAMQVTDNPLNAALLGPGYFAIETAAGERYTRCGTFAVDEQGYLVTQNGNKVASIGGGGIAVGDGKVNIASDGAVTSDGQAAGQIRVVEFESPARLTRVGDNLYAASDEVAKKMGAAADTTVVQNRLEMSNVSLPREMSRMMIGLRAYEANQKVIQGLDGSIGKLIDQVGMPS